MAERIRYQLPVAVFMILKKGNSVLLIKRATTGWMDGFYSLPAGSLDQGEEIIKAAIRECKEEVGVIVKEKNVNLVNTQHCKVEDKTWINIFYLANKWTGSPRVCEPHKHSEVRWESLDTLPKNTINYVKKGIKDVTFKNTYGQFGWNSR